LQFQYTKKGGLQFLDLNIKLFFNKKILVFKNSLYLHTENLNKQ
jgi:hypothetical protein